MAFVLGLCDVNVWFTTVRLILIYRLIGTMASDTTRLFKRLNTYTKWLIILCFGVITAANSVAYQQSEPKVDEVTEWRTPANKNLVYMHLENGLVIIELAPFIAPSQVERFKNLVKEGFYDNTDFYRVIDGFVAQGGDMSESKESKYKAKMTPEFTRKVPADSPFMLIQSPDFLAPQTGYLHGFSAGHDPATNEEWLLHCPGILAFARGNDVQWVTPDFYITIGQATRHLDRNMTSLGRVIYGMPTVQGILRANWDAAGGIIQDKTKRSPIVWAKMAADVPKKDRLAVQVQAARSIAVADRIEGARSLKSEFFHFKGKGNLDLCYYQLKTRVNN